MNNHPVVLEQRIEALTIGWDKSNLPEGIGGKDQQGQKKERSCQECSIDIGHNRCMTTAKHEHGDHAVDGQH